MRQLSKGYYAESEICVIVLEMTVLTISRHFIEKNKESVL